MQKEKAESKKKGKKEEEEESDDEAVEDDPMVKSNVTSLKYEDLPISRKTKSGLKSVNWTKLTHIQVLFHALFLSLLLFSFLLFLFFFFLLIFLLVSLWLFLFFYHNLISFS